MQAIVEAANRGADDHPASCWRSHARRRPAPIVLDVNARVVSLSRMLSRLAGEDVSLETSLNADTWAIPFWTRRSFDQVIVNLVTNARDAVPEAWGRSHIATRNAIVDASDRKTGHGVAPGEYLVRHSPRTPASAWTPRPRERIFQPFFTTKPQRQGKGSASRS